MLAEQGSSTRGLAGRTDHHVETVIVRNSAAHRPLGGQGQIDLRPGSVPQSVVPCIRHNSDNGLPGNAASVDLLADHILTGEVTLG